jgi:transcriptional regulator GlxA family with amidase domain
LPLYQKPAPEAVTPAISDKASLFDHLATDLYAQFRDLAELRARYTVSHGKRAQRLLEHVQEVVSAQMNLLERERGQQQMLERLRRLGVECREALVIVRGVCGLAETGLLLREPTGTYWQFGNALLALWRSCQTLAREMAQQERLYRVSSAPGVLSA